MSLRNALLAGCAAATVTDYAVAVAAPQAFAATTLLVPLTFISSISVAHFLGMWPGLAAAFVVGLAGAMLPDPSTNLSYVFALTIVAGLVGRISDLISEVRHREEALAQRDRRFKVLSENATDLVLVLDRSGHATYASPSHAALLGKLPDAMLGLGYYDVFGPTGITTMHQVLSEATPGHPVRFEISARHADGTTRMLDATARDMSADSAVDGIVINARDVTERHKAETRLVEQSLTDGLTALPNRAALKARIADALAAATREGYRIALLLIDLDRFKDVNDVLGHGAGDVLLVEAAARLRGAIRDRDVVARVGGDEFAVLLPRLGDSSEAMEIAGRLRAAIVRPYAVQGRHVVIGASIGVACSDATSEADGLLRQADVAMHAAKRQRERVSLFSKNEDERAMRRLTMASALQAAIGSDQLELHYQPQIDVRTGAVRGAESLVRWRHPDRGLIFPDAFLPIAIEIGEMDRLTEWVLHAAIRQARRWNRGGRKLRVAVNLSAHDLRDQRLAEMVPGLLANYGLAPEALCLELTETAVMTEAEPAAACLRVLSEAGVRISIDDFGTGYSAISHLKQFPVNEIKIDKQFVLNMENDREDAAIVASTIELAHRLGVDVVVEGVEHATTLAEVRRMGAEYAQGYAIARPLPAADFESWLGEGRSGYFGITGLGATP